MDKPDIDTEHKETDVVLQESATERQVEVPAPSHAENLADNKKGKVHSRRLKLPLPRLALLPTLLVVVCLVNAAGLGANIYVRYRPTADAKKPGTTLVIPKTKAPPDNLKAPAATITTLHYVSNALHVEFDYPVDWRIGGSANDKTLSLSSAPINVSGQEYISKAELVVTITDPSDDGGGLGLISDDYHISSDSEPLTYADPTNFQRKSTHVSFVANRANEETQFVFVSGNLTYRKGQLLGSQKYSAINPHISAYLTPCGVNSYHCQGLSVVPITNDAWQNDATFAKFRQLIASLRFTQ